MTSADKITLSRLCLELSKIQGALEAIIDRQQVALRSTPKLLSDAEERARTSERVAIMEGASAALEDVYGGLRAVLDDET